MPFASACLLAEAARRTGRQDSAAKSPSKCGGDGGWRLKWTVPAPKMGLPGRVSQTDNPGPLRADIPLLPRSLRRFGDGRGGFNTINAAGDRDQGRVSCDGGFFTERICFASP
jgi:hypothetical protein